MHEDFIRRCLDLAIQGEGWVEPNPMVGCVICKEDRIVAEGHHSKYGGPHAEVSAIQALKEDPKECVLYVNLEPCSHHGKTPPCADLVIQKGFRTVVIGSLDPNPLVAGKGAQRLRDAGIEVITNVLMEDCEALNKRFYYHHRNNRPFITLKWAETADGYIGRHISQAHRGKQISNDDCRPIVHRLRANHQAILIGANTANLDNPRLTTRYWKGRDPLKIILSKKNTLEPELKLLKEGKTLVYNSIKAFESEHVTAVHLHHDFFMDELMQDLIDRGIQSILVEGGSQVLQSFIDRSWWNEVYRIIGDQEWKSGVPAPVLNAEAQEVLTVGSQRIEIYKQA